VNSGADANAPWDTLYYNFRLFEMFEHKIRDRPFQMIEDYDRDLGRPDIRRYPICLFNLIEHFK
jgi:hypothetical protein